jgi:hypothetical protein
LSSVRTGTHTQENDFRLLVNTPAELAQQHVAWAKRLQNCPGVPFGIPSVVVARPGHGKTSILAYLARAEAKRIQARGMAEKEAVVFVTWEQVTEEINAVLDTSPEYTMTDIAWGRADMKEVTRHSFGRAGLPIWIIGQSLEKMDALNIPRMPRMFPEMVFGAIESLKADYGVKPTLMCFDYIQMIPIRHQSKRHEQVMEAAHSSKELAKAIACPAAVAVQARRDVDDRTIKIPTLRDAQWASDIEQVTDKYFSQWRPWLTEPHDGTVTINGLPLPVTEELMILSMLKQRYENGRATWALHFQPQYLRLCDLETDIDEALAVA